VGLLFFDEPLVDGHEHFIGVLRVDVLGVDLASPVYFRPWIFSGLLYEIVMPLLHKCKYFWELSLVLDDDLKCLVGELQVLERIVFLFLPLFFEIDAH